VSLITIQIAVAGLLLTLVLLLGLLPPTTRAALIGLSSPTAQIEPWWVARLLILALLLVVLNPEARVLLVFSQFIGVDVLVLLIVAQFRQLLSALRPFAGGSRLVRVLCVALLPRIAPGLSLIRMSPALALYVLLLPAKALLSRITNVDGL
jgi:hypothetical protein